MPDFITFGQNVAPPRPVRVRRAPIGGELGAALINGLLSGVQNRTSLDLLAMQLASQKEEGAAERELQRDILRDGATSRMAEIRELYRQQTEASDKQYARDEPERKYARELTLKNAEAQLQLIANQGEALKNQGIVNAAQLEGMKAQLEATRESIRSNQRTEKMTEGAAYTAALTGRGERAGAAVKAAGEEALAAQAAEAETPAFTAMDAEQAISDLLGKSGGSFGIQGIGQEQTVNRLVELVTDLKSDAYLPGNPLKQKAAVDAARALIPQVTTARSNAGYTFTGQPLSYLSSLVFGSESPKQGALSAIEKELRGIATLPGKRAAVIRATRAPDVAARAAAAPYTKQAEDITNQLFNLKDINIGDVVNERFPGALPGPEYGPELPPPDSSSKNEQVQTPVTFGQPQASNAFYNLPEILDAANFMARNNMLQEGLVA